MESIRREALENLGGEEGVVKGNPYDQLAEQRRLAEEKDNDQSDQSKSEAVNESLRIQALQELADSGNISVKPEDIENKIAEIIARKEAA